MVDGDIVMSTDDRIILKGSQKSLTNPISYDKLPAPSQVISMKNFVETDIRGFGTKVGTYSNYSTIFEALRAGFSPGSKEDEELLLRKKLLREINGQEIDRIKGIEAKGPPKDEWINKWDISPDDPEEIKKQKLYHNSLLANKKPYFFRYLYPELNKKYKQYENSYNEASKCMFRLKMKKLLAKENKTDEERAFVRNYYLFSPLINTNCIMNRLCRKIESVDFDIQYCKKVESKLPHYDLQTYQFSQDVLDKFRKMYQKYNNRNSIAIAGEILDSIGSSEEFKKETRFGIIDAIKEELRDEFAEMNMPFMDGLTYVKLLSQYYSNFNWGFAWDLFDEGILSCIESTETYAPVECDKDDEAAQEYLGRFYKMQKIDKIDAEKIINQDVNNMESADEENIFQVVDENNNETP